jgi:carbon monoxide dehydrogenase subunit G
MAIELEHSFAVPVPPDQAWDVLLDVRRVAPCMPGATVDSVDGDEVTGKIKVKVGPIALTYTGKATFTERDPVARSLKVEAAGKETRGAGTATATVLARLDEENGQTRVNVHTSLNVTGRPAQFGRGVMAEVSGRIIQKFSSNLAEQLASGGVQAAAEPVLPNGQAPDTRMAIPIQELNLPARSLTSLKGEGIETVGELVARTEKDLLSIRNLGAKSVDEIEQRLSDIGLALAQAAPGAALAGAEPGAALAGAEPGTPAAGGSAEPGSADQGAAEYGTAASNGSVPAAGTDPGAGGARAGGAAGSAAWDGSAQRTAAARQGDQNASARRDEPDDDALNLLDVAAGPILKRAVPAVAVLAILILLGRRLRGRRTAG